jgi:hypothetical protein
MTDYKLVAADVIAKPLSRGSYPRLDAQPVAGTPDLSEAGRCSICGEQKIKNSTN